MEFFRCLGLGCVLALAVMFAGAVASVSAVIFVVVMIAALIA